MNAPRTRVQRRPVHGVLLLDKPLGLSSNQALQKAKWLLRAEKAGHTGTLDPLATGVLPLCFGAATKFSQLHLDADKTYVATARLGIRTATGDAEGEVIAERPVQVAAEDLARAEALFTGPIRQVPPMHSALKKDGKALYEYAREGIEVERAPRDVVIHALKIAQTAAAAIRIEASVSKGTYIRTLGEDIGEALGCGAHLSSLRRTATGGFVAGPVHHARGPGSHGRGRAAGPVVACRMPGRGPHDRHAGQRGCRALSVRPASARAVGRCGPGRGVRRIASGLPRHGPRGRP